jgi:hypothetical protein
VPTTTPKTLTNCRRFFEEPRSARHRMYEALRAYFLEGRPSGECARSYRSGKCDRQV